MSRTMKINGLPVIDAAKSIILQVNPKDIDRAKKKDQTECAAALACRRQLGCTEARVHLGRTYVRYNGKWERYLTSGALRDEIVAFDRGGTFQPGKYTLIKMQPSRRFDVSRDTRKKRRYKKRQPKRVIVANVRPIGIYA